MARFKPIPRRQQNVNMDLQGSCKLGTHGMRSSKPKIETVSLDFGLLEVSTEIDDVQKENLQALHSLINRLEDIEKAIILLWLDEYSYDEIADTLGLKRNTVAVKIHRIKEKLSKQI